MTLAHYPETSAEHAAKARNSLSAGLVLHPSLYYIPKNILECLNKSRLKAAPSQLEQYRLNSAIWKDRHMLPFLKQRGKFLNKYPLLPHGKS